MTQYVTREGLQTQLALAEQDEESVLLGGAVRLRELTRVAFKEAARWAASEDLVDRERVRGQLLASAVQEALGGDAPDAAVLRLALTTYYLSAPEQAIDADRWHAALLAASWIDPATGRSITTREEIMQWPNRAGLRDEAARLAQAALDLSEVGNDHLKKESAPSFPATD